MVLAWVARERKDWKAAERHARDAIAQMSRLHGTDNLELAFARRELGLALGELERWDEAIEQVSQCAETFRRVGPGHPDTLEVALEVGELYEKAGRHADAEKNDRRAVELARGAGKAPPGKLGGALLELARMVAYRSPAEAVPIYDEGMRLVVSSPTSRSSSTSRRSRSWPGSAWPRAARSGCWAGSIASPRRRRSCPRCASSSSRLRAAARPPPVGARGRAGPAARRRPAPLTAAR